MFYIMWKDWSRSTADQPTVQDNPARNPELSAVFNGSSAIESCVVKETRLPAVDTKAD